MDKKTSSTHMTNGRPKSANTSKAIESKIQDFMALFPDIVQELTEDGYQIDVPELTERYNKVLWYNVPSGKKLASLTLIDAYITLEDPHKVTPENLRQVYYMSWCVELFLASALVIDDIVDHSEKRRGIDCWYRHPSANLSVISDAFFLEMGVYTILKRHFSNLPYYVPAIELFHDITLNAAVGESLDLTFNSNDKPDLNMFTMERYSAIATYKTAYICLAPVTLAMYMVGIYDAEIHKQAKTVVLDIGHFFQVQDDFRDCFAPTSNTGKLGNDIREGKCSWLIVAALQRAAPRQREILESNFRRPEAEAVQKVRNMYEELDLPNIYSVYMAENLNRIRSDIQQIFEGALQDMLLKYIDRIEEWYL